MTSYESDLLERAAAMSPVALLHLRTAAPPAWSLPEHRAAVQAAGVRFVALDVETTNLEAFPGSVTEVGWWDIGAGVGGVFHPAHTLFGADPEALRISRYEERIAGRPADDGTQVWGLQRLLGGDGTTTFLVGSNPGFDARHLTHLFATYGLVPAWRHRLIDVGASAYWLTGLPVGSTTGLADAARLLEVPLDGHHDAYVDAVAAARIWHALESRRAQLVPSTA